MNTVGRATAGVDPSVSNAASHQFIVPMQRIPAEQQHKREMCLQEELGLLDRVRYASPTSTSPCMQKIAASTEDGGCGRPFVDDYYPDETVPKTNETEYDVEFTYNPPTSENTKEVYFQYASQPAQFPDSTVRNTVADSQSIYANTRRIACIPHHTMVALREPIISLVIRMDVHTGSHAETPCCYPCTGLKSK
jgi:hypothetical protein